MHILCDFDLYNSNCGTRDYDVRSVCLVRFASRLFCFYQFRSFTLQGIPSQTVKSNLALRDGRKDISDIPWHFFSRKHMPILISELVFIKKKWEIMKNHNNS